MKIRNQMFLVAICGLYLLSAISCTNLRTREKKYYCDKNNYVSVTGVIVHMKYDEEQTYLVLGFSDMVPTLDDNSFKIVGDNLKIVKKNGIDDKLEIGKTVTFTTAPKYFGDGYIMPIVELIVDEEVLLEFNQGYDNLLTWLNVD